MSCRACDALPGMFDVARNRQQRAQSGVLGRLTTLTVHKSALDQIFILIVQASTLSLSLNVGGKVWRNSLCVYVN